MRAPTLLMMALAAAARLIRRAAWMSVLACASGIGIAAAQPNDSAQPAGVSTAYLERFIRYVRWPNETSAGQPWRVCIAGDIAATAQHFAGTRARSREILVIAPRDPSEAPGCHVLDLSQVSAADLGAWLDATRGRSVLAIGTGASFCTRGGHICFTHDGSPPFEINLSAAQAAGLRISARLLAREPGDASP